MRFRAAAQELIDFLLPSACLGCGARIPHGHTHRLVCTACTARLRPLPWPRCPRCDHPTGTGRAADSECRECRHWPPTLTRARSAVALEPPADALVHAFKYEGWKELAPLLASFMDGVRVPCAALQPEPIIMPVPTTSARRRTRGYNQAEVLARALSGLTGRLAVDGLVRARGGRSQISLHPTERKANVERAFSVVASHAESLRGGHIVLVDDVLTTGSTVAAISRVLGEAGVASVTALTLARAVPFRE